MPLTILVNMSGANVTIVEEHSRVWTISLVAAIISENLSGLRIAVI